MAVRRIAAALCLYAGMSVEKADAADVIMGDNNYCDTSLPLTASDMYLDCGNEGDGCHLGSKGGVGATLKFNGVADAISDNLVYVSVRVSKFEEITSVVTSATLSKQITNLQEAYICNSVTSYNGNCPNDGTYKYHESVLLPSLGDKDWFLTGQHFGAQVQVYADSSGSTLIGDCHLRLTTTVTAGASAYGDPPSAARAAGITAVVFAAAALLICAGCAWMDKRDKELEGSDFEMLEDPRSGQNAVV